MELNTQEWADAFKNYLNKNPNYKKSASTWEGALILVFKAENIKLTEDVRLYLDLYHGECREARFLKPGEEIEHEYEIISTESYWNALAKGKADPSKALMSGKIKIKGNINKLMRYPKAAAYILKYMRRLLEDW
ncbi:MAG: SCP2 sterol-binding domain-containing protein [Promethearchaeota archaeon]